MPMIQCWQEIAHQSESGMHNEPCQRVVVCDVLTIKDENERVYRGVCSNCQMEYRVIVLDAGARPGRRADGIKPKL